MKIFVVTTWFIYLSRSCALWFATSILVALESLCIWMMLIYLIVFDREVDLIVVDVLSGSIVKIKNLFRLALSTGHMYYLPHDL